MYAFVIPTVGMNLLTKLLAGEPLVISRVMVGSGKMPNGMEPSTITDLISPVAAATSTVPAILNQVCSFIIEYRSDLNGGLAVGFWLNEFGVFAFDPDVGEVLLYYGNLGDYPEWVSPYKGGLTDIRRYPVSIGLSSEAEVTLTYPADAFMSAKDVEIKILEAIEALKKELAGSVTVFSPTRPTGDWTLWLKDLGGIPNFPIDDDTDYDTFAVFSPTRPTGSWKLWLKDLGVIPNYPIDNDTILVLNTAPLNALGNFVLVDGSGGGETIINITDDTQAAKDNDIIIVE